MIVIAALPAPMRSHMKSTTDFAFTGSCPTCVCYGYYQSTDNVPPNFIGDFGCPHVQSLPDQLDLDVLLCGNLLDGTGEQRDGSLSTRCALQRWRDNVAKHESSRLASNKTFLVLRFTSVISMSSRSSHFE